MSKILPTDSLQSELRKTFGRRPTTALKTRPTQQGTDAKPQERQSGSAAKRTRAEARSRESALTSRRRTGTAGTRQGGNARRKLTCPIDAALYKQLKRISIDEERPLREIVETILRSYVAES